MKTNKFEESIIRTIAFYDAVGGVALTKVELYKYLINPGYKITFGDFCEELTHKWQNIEPHIRQYRGFYFLKKNSAGYDKRISTGKTSIKKQSSAKKMARIISLLPYVRMVAVTGSLSHHSTNENSDIDMLIVSKGGHIWTTRMIVSAVMHILGKRRYGNKTKDRICLNHYISDSNLSLRPRNIFSSHITSSLMPLWSNAETYKLFNRQNRLLTSAHFPNYKKLTPRNIRKKSNIVEFLFSPLEPPLKWIQLKKIYTNLKKEGSEGKEMKGVIFDDEALVFHHPRPKNREAIFLYNKNIKEIGLIS